MPEFDSSSPGVALWSAAAAGAMTGILPIGLAEATALAIGLVSPRWLAFAMGAAFTVGHVAAKLPWYWLGTQADLALGPWATRHVQRARAMLAARPTYGLGVLGVSAVTSVPPFHVAAIAAGLTQLPFVPFVALCLAGRLVRFGVLVTAPALLRQWFG